MNKITFIYEDTDLIDVPDTDYRPAHRYVVSTIPGLEGPYEFNPEGQDTEPQPE